MDWYGILGTAIGGGIGAGLSGVVARAFPEKMRATAGAVLVVALATGGAYVARHFFSGADAQIERALMSDPTARPLMEAWREGDPQSFAALTSDLARNARTKSQIELIDLAREHFFQMAQQRLIYLDDADLAALIKVGRDQFRELKVASPQSCPAMFHGLPMGDVRPALSDALVAREHAVLIAALRADAQPGPVFTQGQFVAVTQQIYDATAARVGEDIALLDPSADVAGAEARMCEVAEAFFDQIAALPQADAATMMRSLSVAN